MVCASKIILDVNGYIQERHYNVRTLHERRVLGDVDKHRRRLIYGPYEKDEILKVPVRNVRH